MPTTLKRDQLPEIVRKYLDEEYDTPGAHVAAAASHFKYHQRGEGCRQLDLAEIDLQRLERFAVDARTACRSTTAPYAPLEHLELCSIAAHRLWRYTELYVRRDSNPRTAEIVEEHDKAFRAALAEYREHLDKEESNEL